MPLIDIVGRSFNRLTVLSYAGNRKWNCRCECGNELPVRTDCLKDGNTKSCGCLKIEKYTTHGQSKSKTRKRRGSPSYLTWLAMIQRCYDPKHVAYHQYGGAGVVICDRWRHSFEAFLSDMGERPIGHTIDRYPNKSGSYEPGNCRWATKQQQSWNRKSNRLLEHDGKALCIGEWAVVVGIPRTVIQDRLRLGWSDEKAITTPFTPR